MMQIPHSKAIFAIFIVCSSLGWGCGDSGGNGAGKTDNNGQVVYDELCDDQIDNDEDGVVDEDCACNFYETTAGVCAGSTIDAETGECTRPADYEAVEVSCDGMDNNCDGVVDEECACEYADSSDGVCANSTIAADSGECAEPLTYESDETTCDQTDNDCDAIVDEGCPCTYADTDAGVCAQASIDATSGECAMPENYTAEETGDFCEGVDNDCDGEVDEECACNYNGSAEGVCQFGEPGDNDECLEPVDYEAVETICDDKDNDCDGEVDEKPPVHDDLETSNSQWSIYTNQGNTSVNSAATDHVHGGAKAVKASSSDGACGINGIARQFTLVGPPESISLWVRATTDNWGRVNIYLVDSNGEHLLWEKKGGGSDVDMTWTELTLTETAGNNPTPLSELDSTFTLVIGNGDDSQYCSAGDHTWSIWADDITITQPSCQ